MKIKYFITSCFLITNLYSDEYSLPSLVDLAISNNTDISMSRLKVANQEAAIQAARSSYLPSLNAVQEVAHYDIQNSISQTDGSVNSITLSASQLLYDFGKTTSNISASKEQYKATLEELMCKISSEIIVICKSVNFGKSSFHVIPNNQKISTIITDGNIKENEIEVIENTGIKLIITD